VAAAGVLGSGHDGEEGQGEHGQGGPPVPGVPAADLVLIQPGQSLEVGDTLQDYSHRLPSEVEIINPRHPLPGQRVPVVSGWTRRVRTGAQAFFYHHIII
jgi:hypothetical protein